MELKENVVVKRKKTKNVTNRNNENNEKKYSVETQKILRQSTFDQLQIQRRLELLNKKETNRVGCCRKRINSLYAYMKYKFTTAWTDDVLKIDICKNVSLAIGYPCGFKFLFLVFAVLLLTGMFAVFLVIMKIIG